MRCRLHWVSLSSGKYKEQYLRKPKHWLVPSFPPLQVTFVCALATAVNAVAGSVMVKFKVAVHLLTSVTVQEIAPAARSVTDAVPSPLGVPAQS